MNKLRASPADNDASNAPARAPKATILVVEDEEDVAQLLCELVESIGYNVQVCQNGKQLKSALLTTTPALVLLDRQLPDGDGISLVGPITEKGLPLIVLTGKGSEIDRVIGLEIGADDYIVKPFSLHEVAARIRAVLRRSDRVAEDHGESDGDAPIDAIRTGVIKGFEFSGFIMDCQKRLVFDRQGDPVDLTVAEFDVLHAIVQGNGRVLTRVQILELTHNSSMEVFDRTIDVLIFRLRRKMENNPQNPAILKTERGVGYKLGVHAESLKKP